MKQPSEKYCYECAAVLPRTATVCGSCLAAQPALPQPAPAAAAPAPSHAWDATHALLAVGAVMLLGMGAHSLRTPPPAPSPSASASTPAPPQEDVQAWAEARRLVAAHLRAPRDAAFSSEHNTTRLGPGTYEIRSSLEAFNTHGVPIRTIWTAVVARTADGWQLERLDARN